MRRPLHWQGVREDGLPSAGNGGLWYAKIGGEWKRGEAGQPAWMLEKKESWFNTFDKIGGRSFKAGAQTQLARAGTRLGDVVTAQAGTVLTLQTVEPFVTGLGLSSPTETGFAWHWTLGTPFLPGAAVKGIAVDDPKDLDKLSDALGVTLHV